MKNEDSVTRVEIAVAISDAFAQGNADRAEILAAAATGASRSAVMETLKALPDRRYGKLNELWEHLDHVPVGG